MCIAQIICQVLISELDPAGNFFAFRINVRNAGGLPDPPKTGVIANTAKILICHQVGVRHQAAMLEAMGLPIERDFATYPVLGNTGSVALPLTLATAAAGGAVAPGDRVALLGIGSGINSVMLGATWGQTVVRGNLPVAIGSV